MRNSSIISLPLWPKQLVTVCGHVGLPAFGREQRISQTHVRVQPVSSWKEFPQSLFPQTWQKQRHHQPSQGMESFEAELRCPALSIHSTFLIATFSSSSLQSAKVSLLTTISAWSSQTASVGKKPSVLCFLWLQEGSEVLHWQSEGGMLNNLVGVTKAVLFNGK